MLHIQKTWKLYFLPIMIGCFCLNLGACVSVSSEYEDGILNQTFNSPVQARMPTVVGLQSSLTQAPVQARTDWWGGFEDKTLTDLIDFALRNASTIQQALNQIDRAEAQVFGLSQNNKPTGQFLNNLQLTVPRVESTSFQTNSQEVSFGPNPSSSVGFSLSWQPDLYGALKANRAAGREDLLNSHASLENAQRLIVSQVARQYMALRNAQTTMAFNEKFLEAYKAHEKTIRYLISEGVATKFEVQQIAAQISNFEIQTLNAQTQAITAINTMFTLVGGRDLENFSAKLWQDSNLPALPPIPQQVDPVRLIAARPDLRAAEHALRAAAERAFISKTQLYPNISLSGQTAFSLFSTSVSGITRSIFNGDVASYFNSNVAASLSQTLLNRRSLKAAVMSTEANLRAAGIQYEQIVRTIVSEVDTSLANRYAAEQQFNAVKKQLNTTDSNLADMRALFDAGLAQRSQMFQAQISRLNSVSQQYTTYFAVLQAHINLMNTTVY